MIKFNIFACNHMNQKFPNIVATPGIVSGRPRIINTRLSVEFILGLMADGSSVENIVSAYPQLTVEQVREAIRFATDSLRQDHFVEFQRAS
jgi:uncharacterized protein (DUF433 family)